GSRTFFSFEAFTVTSSPRFGWQSLRSRVRGRAAWQRRTGSSGTHGAHGTGHGAASQISLAYSAMVRSLENFPDAATFRMAVSAQPAGSVYRSIIRWSASR